MTPHRRRVHFDDPYAHQTESADSHATAIAGRKPFEPGRVRRQQQWLLYGSGAAITVFVLVCTALVARLDLQESLAQYRSRFLIRKAELLTEMEVVRALQNRYVENIELVAKQGTAVSPDTLGRYADDRGRLVVVGQAGRVAFAAFAVASSSQSAKAYAPWGSRHRNGRGAIPCAARGLAQWAIARLLDVMPDLTEPNRTEAELS
ncbi:hypothetical protein [Burkholderia sp. SIMBA_062]|uniref:hypothetical protein n=1 Tax=Burkholderia sp. SIMBA_062 TaxID=3085803 RepID=UPI003978664A